MKEEKPSSTIKEVHVEVPKEEVEKKREQILKFFVSRAKIHGFRPGNAPREIVERVFKEEIKEKSTDELIQEYGKKAIEKTRLTPLHAPYVTQYSYKDDGSLSFTLSFEVIPSYDVDFYSGIEIEVRRKIVGEKEIESGLQSLRENFAQLIPVTDRGVKVGDIVEIEIQRKILSEKRTLPVERYRWKVEKEIEEIPGIFENVLGMKNGEEKIFIITYPEEFSKKNLRNKEIETRVKVLSIKEKIYPELNEEFVTQIGDYKDLQDLKNKLKDKLEEEFKKREREEAEREILKVLREKNSVEVPQFLVNIELESIASSLDKRGGMSEQEESRLIEAFRDLATENVKNYLILSKISEKEGIKVEKNEVETELRKAYNLNNLSYSEIERLREKIEKKLIFRKTLDFVLDKAIIKYKEEI
ncbi:MAG: trigger factor [Candidatus Aminicenantia bacterium]